MKAIFTPIGILSGLLAGLLAKRGFERIWALVDEEEPPAADQRHVSLPKLVAALAIEGAVFRLVKGLVDHGARSGFAHLTGSWPGEDRDEEQADT
jgi:hypothetical protein